MTSQLDELVSKSLSEFVQLQKSFHLVTLYSTELFSFLETILTNYKVFYLQRQENLLSHLKTDIGSDSKSKSVKTDDQSNIFKILKLIFQSVQHIESTVRISHPLGQDSSLINPLDVLARGTLGKDVANLVNTLRIGVNDFSNVENTLKECYEKHLSTFNREIEEYNSIISNLLQLKQKQEAIQYLNLQPKTSAPPTPASAKVRSRQSPNSGKEKRRSLENRPPFDLGLG